VTEKLIILRDTDNVDENGVSQAAARQGKNRRMKIKEVNETQISE
jgi:checkpoint serine/threonine-protein kinase